MKQWLPILVALAPTYLVRFSIGGIPTTLFELLIWGTVIAALLRVRIRNQESGIRNLSPAWRAGLSLVILGTIVGIVVNPDLRTALGAAKGFVCDPLLLGWLVVRFLTTEEIPAILLGYLTSATIVSLISLTSHWLGLPWATASDGRLLGLYGLEANASPNYLAFWVAPAVALGIAWIGTGWQLRQEARDKRQELIPHTSYLIPLATITSFIALVGTDSRAGIASAIIAGALALVAYYRSTLVEFRFAQGVGWLLLIGLVLFGVAVIQPDFSVSPDQGGRVSSSNNIRWEIWQTTGRLLTTSPTAFVGGLGLGSYQDRFAAATAHQVNYPEFITPRALTPHNLWLNAWVNQGLFGLIGITLLIIVATIRLWKAEPTHRAALVTAVLLTILLQDLVDTPNWKNDTAALFWLILATVVLIENRTTD